jgi:hypothetical protein
MAFSTERFAVDAIGSMLISSAKKCEGGAAMSW